MSKKQSEDLDLEIYNEEQRFWANVSENCTATIKQFEDSIKLQEAIKIMSDAKIEEFSEKQNI